MVSYCVNVFERMQMRQYNINTVASAFALLRFNLN